jgi:hypothetical protein
MDDESTPTSTRSGAGGGGLFTIPLLCLGVAAIGACVLVPQIDANRRLAYERDKLAADLDQIKQQTALNEKFLAETETDPQLAQRLAQRQMKFIRQGESLLSFKSNSPPTKETRLLAAEVSPFSLVRVPAPAALPPYQGAGGVAADLLDSHIRLYCLAGGLFLVAAGLVLGSNEPDARVSS